MREQILELILNHPKHYIQKITKEPELLNWVYQNTLINSTHLPSIIYSAIYSESNICINGNVKKFDRFSTGFIGCGPAKSCKCTAEFISKNVSKTKQSISQEVKQESNLKRMNTMMSRYGVNFNSQREEVKEILAKPKIPLIIHEKLIDYDWLNEEYNIKKRSLSDIASELGVYYSTVTEYCQKFGFKIRHVSPRSTEEIQIANYIKSLGFDIIESDRDIIRPKELDIVVPSKKFAIEVNGIRWHSFHPSCGIPENRNQHFSKTSLSNTNGYDLIHITDHEWKFKSDIIKSLIRTKLGLNNKIPARKCTIKLIDKKTEQEFLNNYHIQGYTASLHAIGLFFNDELMMMMSIGKSRFNTKYDYEIIRMCAKSDITVVGGVSKLITYVSKIIPNSLLVSYCDLSKGSGIGYLNAGFTLDGSSSPGYFWTDGNIIISRYKSQKNKLHQLLPSFDSNLSEALNMFNANYRRYWDCGNLIFTINT